MAPIPNPDKHRFHGPAHRAHGVYGAPVHRAGPVVAPVRQAVVHTAPAPAPVAIKPTPVVQPPAAPPVVAKPPTKLVQLQAVVGQAVSKGSSLSVSSDVSQGKAGGVSLSLPTNLAEMLRDQAAKFGLRRAARQADVSATLSGSGYAVDPPGKQTQPLKAGQPVKFSWQVTPSQNATGPLSAQVDASLKGQGEPKPLSLATLQATVAQAAGQAQQAASGLHLPSLSHVLVSASHFLDKLLGHHDQAAAPTAATAPAPQTADQQSPLRERTLPIIGRVTVRAQIAAFLAFIAILILLLIQRNMADQRRAAERRRYRSRSENYRPVDLDSEPPPAAAT
jgi:hypothetical protein